MYPLLTPRIFEPSVLCRAVLGHGIEITGKLAVGFAYQELTVSFTISHGGTMNKSELIKIFSEKFDIGEPAASEFMSLFSVPSSRHWWRVAASRFVASVPFSSGNTKATPDGTPRAASWST